MAHRHFAFLELGDLVKLGAGHSNVGLRIELYGRFAELGVEKEHQQGHGDHVGRDGFFVVFGGPKCACSQAGVGDERINPGQFNVDSVDKGLDRSIRAQVKEPHLEDV